MAKKKKAKKEKSKKKDKKESAGWKKRLLYIFIIFAAIIFMPTTIIMVFGMIPTIIIFALDTNRKKTKAMTVGPLNLAGCVPFLLYLWETGRDFDNAIIIVTNPLYICVMWGAAAMGYMVFWALSGIVGAFMEENTKGRLIAIKKHQEKLVERWGREVTGEFELDAYGFAVHKPEEEEEN